MQPKLNIKGQKEDIAAINQYTHWTKLCLFTSVWWKKSPGIHFGVQLEWQRCEQGGYRVARRGMGEWGGGFRDNAQPCAGRSHCALSCDCKVYHSSLHPKPPSFLLCMFNFSSDWLLRWDVCLESVCVCVWVGGDCVWDWGVCWQVHCQQECVIVKYGAVHHCDLSHTWTSSPVK